METELAFPEVDHYRETRDLFRSVEFTEQRVIPLLGTDRIYIPRPLDAAGWRRRLTGHTTLEELIRLIVIGDSLPEATLEAAIGPRLMKAWLAAGIITKFGNELKAALNIVPFQDLWIVSDRPQHGPDGPRDNFVMGIGGSTRTLLNVTNRKPVGRTLDLGTGCGTFGLFAAKHSEHVIAVDLNPRAAAMVRFNAALNGITNIEARVGNLFEPVAGEQFDLIVSNPPFVVSPSDGPMYRDGRMSADGFCENLFRQLPAYLADGGFAHVLLNWIHPKDGDWHARLRNWFTDSGSDVWIMHSEDSDPATYAALWIRQTGYTDDTEAAATFDRWLKYFDELGIQAISMGLANLRRRSSGVASAHPNWFRVTRTPDRMTGQCSDDVLSFFATTDYLIAHPDAELVRRRFIIVPTVSMIQTCTVGDGGWRIESSEFRRTDGIRYTGAADPMIASILIGCDGSHTLGELIETACQDWEVEPAKVATDVLRVFRSLLERGFVRPLEL